MNPIVNARPNLSWRHLKFNLPPSTFQRYVQARMTSGSNRMFCFIITMATNTRAQLNVVSLRDVPDHIGDDVSWQQTERRFRRPSFSPQEGMLPADILDQVTSLNTQHRELVSVINQFSRSNDITSQLILDDLTSRIKAGFAEADRGIEVSHLLCALSKKLTSRILKL